jgi:hypothetical protein
MLAQSATSLFKKAAPPRLGDAYGAWGPDPITARMPGGSVWQMDLSRLTLSDFRLMRQDYQLNASLGMLQAMVAQADWSIYTKGQETDPKAQQMSDEIEEGLRRRWIPLVRALSQAFWAGYAPTVLNFDLNKTSKLYEVTRYKDLVPENCRVNWRTTTGADNTKMHHYDGILNSGKTIPAENTLWFPLGMQNGDYYGTKLLTPAFPSWFFSQLIHLYTNRYFERFGEPTAVGYYPVDGEVTGDDGTKVSARDVMAGVLNNLRSRGVVTIPSERDPETKEREWDIQYLESQMRGADFDRYIDRLDEEKSLALFTPVLMFRTGERGSFNLATLHQDVFQFMLNWMCGDIKTYLDEYLIARLHDVNYGPNAPRSEIRFRTLGRLTDSGGQSVLQALIQNGGAKVTPRGLKDLGDYLGVDLEYLTGEGAAGTDQSATPSGAADPDARPLTDTVNRILDPQSGQQAKAGDGARKQLVAARRRLDDQLRKAFSRDGYDREVALNKIKLGYKGAFINDMVNAGASSTDATHFFDTFERSVRDAFTAAESESDAAGAVRDVYADFGFDTD